MPDNDLCPTERFGVIAWRLARGEQLTTADAARLTGLTRFGAWHLLDKLSRVLPLTQVRTSDGRLVWRSIDSANLMQ